jgi:hypothetical protein
MLELKSVVAPELAALGAVPFWAPFLLSSYRREVGRAVVLRQIYRGAAPLLLGTLAYGPIAAAADALPRLATPDPSLAQRAGACALVGVLSSPLYTFLRSRSIGAQQSVAVPPLAGAAAFAGRNALFAPLLLVLPPAFQPSLGVASFPCAAALSTLVTMPADVLISRRMLTGQSYAALIRQFRLPDCGPLRGWTLRFVATTIEFAAFTTLRAWLE